jgi:hypothetical protein
MSIGLPGLEKALLEKRDATISTLTAERDRMAGALREIQRLGEQGMEPDYTEWLTFHDKVAQIAREALSP